MKRQKIVEPSIDIDTAEQLIKVVAVMLRDNSSMTAEEAFFAFSYCWRHTESIEASEKRESGL